MASADCQPSKKARAGKMKLRLARTMWGVLDFANEADCQPARWESVFEKLQAEGYTAIEACIGPFDPFVGKVDEFKALLTKYSLSLISQVHTCSYPVASRKMEDHLTYFKKYVIEAKEVYGAVMVNSHSGCDSWPIETSVAFFKKALEIEKEVGIKVVHETHRQRVLFNPWITRDVLKQVPDLKVNADLSHFVVVGERVYDDGKLDPEWPEVLNLIARSCHLIHARVGYAESPQVPEPAAPEYETELLAHEGWWKAIVQDAAARGDHEMFIEPEHGCSPYLQALPYTKAPVADLWEVNSFIGKRVQGHFDSWVA